MALSLGTGRAVQSILGFGERRTTEKCAPHRILLRWPGGVVRGIMWSGGDRGMTGCLECPLARPVLA